MSGYIRNPDPQFPDRPQHPDFWVLSESVIANDEYGESGRAEERIAEFCDPESLRYIAMGRVSHAYPNVNPEAGIKLAAAIIDGFVTGCEYMRRKLEQQYGTGKSGGS